MAGEQVRELQRTERERPTLIFFGARTSGRSRKVESYLAQVLQRRHNHQTFRLYRVDGEARPDLVRKYRVERLPTLVVVDHKRICARIEDPPGSRAITLGLGPWLH